MRSFHWHHDTELAEFSETHAWERGWVVVRAHKCRVFQWHQGVGGVFGDMGQWVGRVRPQNQFAPTFVITYSILISLLLYVYCSELTHCLVQG